MDCMRLPSNPIWHCLSHESRSSTDNDESKEGSAKNPVRTLLYCEVVEGFECRSREAQSTWLLFVGEEGADNLLLVPEKRFPYFFWLSIDCSSVEYSHAMIRSLKRRVEQPYLSR